MLEFLKRLFGQPETSSTTAKDRLRLVLMTDHLALAPDTIEQMKRDLIDVISRYVEVDREKVEVNFEREDKVLAMLANIPITGVNRPKAGEGGMPVKANPISVPPPPANAPAVTPSLGIDVGATAALPPPQKRRRRRKNHSIAHPAPAR